MAFSLLLGSFAAITMIIFFKKTPEFIQLFLIRQKFLTEVLSFIFLYSVIGRMASSTAALASTIFAGVMFSIFLKFQEHRVNEN